MKPTIASATLAVLFTLTVTGCAATSETPAPAASAQPAMPVLSPEAQQALTQAEADIKQAKAAYGLWTVAEDALKAAQEAAKAGDSAAVLKQAGKASKLAKLGLEQTKYPNTELK